MTHTIRDNRTLVLDTKWNTGWFSNVPSPEACPNVDARSPWECYFRAFSTCTVEDALRAANKTSTQEMEQDKGTWAWGAKIKDPSDRRVTYAKGHQGGIAVRA